MLSRSFFYLFFYYFFSVGLLSVLRGHSIFSSPPQRPMTSDFEGFSIPDFIHDIFFPILILQKEPVFSLFECWVPKTGTTGTILKRLWYDAALDWGLNPGPPALEAITMPLGYRGGGCCVLKLECIMFIFLCILHVYCKNCICAGWVFIWVRANIKCIQIIISQQWSISLSNVTCEWNVIDDE